MCSIFSSILHKQAAKAEIASIKIVAPRMAKRVVDRSMQSLGGLGLSQDTPLAHMWTSARVRGRESSG